MNAFARLLLALALAAPACLHAQNAFPVPAQSSGSIGWAASADAVLPEGQAFQVEAWQEAGKAAVVLELKPQPGYALYRDTLRAQAPGNALGTWNWPAGVVVDDPNLGPREVYDHPVQVRLPLIDGALAPTWLEVRLQGCKAHSVCYPPMRRQVAVGPAPATPASPPKPDPGAAAIAGAAPLLADDQALAQSLGRLPTWQALALFLGLGVLMGLTPCALPMVPVVLGLVAGQAAGGRRALGLAGTYVLAHALSFAVLGALAAWLGAGVASWGQASWAIMGLAGALAALGAATIWGVPLQVPVRLQAWAGARGRGGSLAGAAGLGMLSSLILGPCVAPPLAGAVLFLAHRGDPWLGGAALLALGLGMGVPLLAAAGGWARWVRPSGMGRWAGPAMGLGMMAVAGWLALRAWPAWAVLLGLVGVGVGIGALAPGGKGRLAGKQPVWRLSAAAGLAVAGMLAIGLPGHGQVAGPEREFQSVGSLDELDAALARAQRAGQTVVLDVAADWCSTCKDMDRKTFADPVVAARLSGARVLALKADITANTGQDQALLRRYGLVGPPATLFFHNSQEQRELRLVGFEAQGPFLDRLRLAQCQAPTISPQAC